jgi:hypothetical protein
MSHSLVVTQIFYNMKCTSVVHLTIISIIVALMYKVQLGSVMYMLMKN